MRQSIEGMVSEAIPAAGVSAASSFLFFSCHLFNTLYLLHTFSPAVLLYTMVTFKLTRSAQHKNHSATPIHYSSLPCSLHKDFFCHGWKQEIIREAGREKRNKNYYKLWGTYLSTNSFYIFNKN